MLANLHKEVYAHAPKWSVFPIGCSKVYAHTPKWSALPIGRSKFYTLSQVGCIPHWLQLDVHVHSKPYVPMPK